MHIDHNNNFPACGTRTNHRDGLWSSQAGWDGYELNSSAATARKTNIIAKTEAEIRRVNADFVDLTQRFTQDLSPEESAKAAENRRADADLVEMVAPWVRRDPSPEEYAKALAEYRRVTTGAWAEYDRVTTGAWVEYLNITNKSAYLFERAMDPDTLPAYLRGIAGSFVEYRRVITTAEADLQRILADADAQLTRFTPWRLRNRGRLSTLARTRLRLTPGYPGRGRTSHQLRVPN